MDRLDAHIVLDFPRPDVMIDEAHHNFHTADGRYRPCAEFLRRDGYSVDGLDKALSADSLKAVDVLVRQPEISRSASA